MREQEKITQLLYSLDFSPSYLRKSLVISGNNIVANIMFSSSILLSADAIANYISAQYQLDFKYVLNSNVEYVQELSAKNDCQDKTPPSYNFNLSIYAKTWDELKRLFQKIKDAKNKEQKYAIQKTKFQEQQPFILGNMSFYYYSGDRNQPLKDEITLYQNTHLFEKRRK
jgi:hypothetical protein